MGRASGQACKKLPTSGAARLPG